MSRRIVLRFIRSSGFVPAAICWVTNGFWSHVEMGWEENGVLVGWAGAHAGTGFQIRALNYTVPAEERQYSIPVTEEQYAKWRLVIQAMIGTRYNYLDILGLLLRKRKWTTPHRAICSDAAITSFIRIGLYLLNVLETSTYLITPEELHLSPLLIGKCIYHGGSQITR